MHSIRYNNVDTGCNVRREKKTQQNKELDNEIGAESLFPDHVDIRTLVSVGLTSRLNSIMR